MRWARFKFGILCCSLDGVAVQVLHGQRVALVAEHNSRAGLGDVANPHDLVLLGAPTPDQDVLKAPRGKVKCHIDLCFVRLTVVRAELGLSESDFFPFNLYYNTKLCLKQ